MCIGYGVLCSMIYLLFKSPNVETKNNTKDLITMTNTFEEVKLL